MSHRVRYAAPPVRRAAAPRAADAALPRRRARRCGASSRSRCGSRRWGTGSGSRRACPTRRRRRARWYREHGRPVAIVVPTFGDPAIVAPLLRSLAPDGDRARTRVIVVRRRLRAASTSRALRALAAAHGVELVARRGAARLRRQLQPRPARGARRTRTSCCSTPTSSRTPAGSRRSSTPPTTHGAGIAGRASCCTPTTRSSSAAWSATRTTRSGSTTASAAADADSPEAQRHAGHAGGHRRVHVHHARRRSTTLGELDEGYEMAFEDVDYCLRAWDAGHRVLYAPAAALTHHESKTRGTMQGARELRSQARFWARWGDWFDRRDVARRGRRAADRLRHAGHRRRRRAPRRLHAPQRARRARPRRRAVDARRRAARTGSTCSVPVRTFPDYPALAAALAPLDAIKVATWWETRRLGVGGVGPARHPRLLGPGHRDVATTATGRAAAPRCSRATGPSSRTSPARSGSPTQLRKLRRPTCATFTPGLDVDRFRPLPTASTARTT